MKTSLNKLNSLFFRLLFSFCLLSVLSLRAAEEGHTDPANEVEPAAKEAHDEHAGHEHEEKPDAHAEEEAHDKNEGHDHAEEAAHGESHEAHGEQDEHGAEEDAEEDDEDEHEEEGIVILTPEVRREFGIELSRAGPGTLYEEVVLPGEVRFNKAALAYATPRFEGTVRDIRVKLAERVEKGQVLATLESVDTLRVFEVKAPLDGVIVSYDITPGQTVAAGTSIFTVADLSTVWGDLRVYQANFGQIREGKSVRISGGHNLPTYRGTIDYVAPTVDEETRTGLARIVIKNPERAWKPGMFIQGAVAIDRQPVEIMVPRSAVLTMENSPVVFVQTDEGFEPRPIEIGHSDRNHLEVVRGLDVGETYISKNPISIKAEMGKGAFGGHNH